MPKKFRKVKNRGTKKDSASGTTTPERFQPRHSTYSLKTRTERAFHGSKHLKHLPTQGLKFLQEFRHDRKLFFIAEIKFFSADKKQKSRPRKISKSASKIFYSDERERPSIDFLYTSNHFFIKTPLIFYPNPLQIDFLIKFEPLIFVFELFWNKNSEYFSSKN